MPSAGARSVSDLPSRDDVFDNSPVNVGQAIVATGMTECQPLVINAHQMQDGCVQVVYVDVVLDRMPFWTACQPNSSVAR